MIQPLHIRESFPSIVILGDNRKTQDKQRLLGTSTLRGKHDRLEALRHPGTTEKTTVTSTARKALSTGCRWCLKSRQDGGSSLTES